MKKLGKLKLKIEHLLEELKSVKSDAATSIEKQNYKAVNILQERQKNIVEKLRAVQTELFSLKEIANKQDAKEIQTLLDQINS